MTSWLADLREGLHRCLAEDERVYFFGEDVLDPYGGAFKVSAGLSTAFPGRVFTTPISEAGIVGLATGMALRGLRPVVEIMFGDFLMLAGDQIVNHAAKFHAMYAGQVSVPIVVRTPMGGGRGYGATHSQSIEKLFLGVPHLRIVAPSIAHSPGDLLVRATLADSGPVLFIEHKLLYPAEPLQPGGALRVEMVDGPGGFPSALVANFSDGVPDVTVCAYGGVTRWMTSLLERLRGEEIRVLAVMPSSLKPLPVDTLAEAASRSGRVVIVEEGTSGFNWGSEVAAQLYERLWRGLRAPIRRVASHDDIVPSATDREATMLVSPERVEAAILEVLA